MAQTKADRKRFLMRGLVLWILFLSFVLFMLLTVILVYNREEIVRLTLIFEENILDIFGFTLVLFYVTVEIYMTFYFYHRTMKTNPAEAYPYALATVVTGVVSPYIYALLLSIMGIMHNTLPVLYVGILYILGLIAGLRIIPDLTTHIRSD